MRYYDTPRELSEKVLEDFSGVSGRLELIQTIGGVNIYNDTTATTPEATIAGLKALGKNIILIMGGADKNLDMTKLTELIPKHCKAVFVLPGTGTDRIKGELASLKGVKVTFVKSLELAFEKGIKLAKPIDSLLFSPAFASFGMFKNEFDRGEKFLTIVNRYDSIVDSN